MCKGLLTALPPFKGDCNKRLPVSLIWKHVTDECVGATRSRVWKFEDRKTWTINSNMATFGKVTIPFIADGKHFFLTTDETKSGGLAACVQMLGTETECSAFGSTITLHRMDDPKMEGFHLHKFVGDVHPIDMDKMDRTNYGLHVGTGALAIMLSVAGNLSKVKISVSLEKY